MTDYGTIKIPRDDYERHNERRQDLGITWAEYLDGEAPEGQTVNPDELAEQVVDLFTAEVYEPASDDLAEQLARIEDAARTAEERAGAIQRDLEAEGIGRS